MLGKLNRCLTEFSILLVTAALIAGMVGCVDITQDIKIRTWYDLDAIRGNLTGSYILMNDLDSTTAGYEELAGPNAQWQPPRPPGNGWLPIGTEDDAFTGRLDGQGHEIRDLIIFPGLSHVGVFSFVGEGGQIEDIGVGDIEVIGGEVAGCLAAVCYGTLTNCYSAASVRDQERAGGLVGENYGTVTGSYCTGNVSGDASAGGLVGTNCGTVSHCYATGTVIGGYIAVGGLVGANNGTVTGSYSRGDVSGLATGSIFVGGLVGLNGGPVSNSYSTGSVTGEGDVGGLVGVNWHGGIVSDSYATGNVNGERDVGGLVGGNLGTVSNSYSTGSVTGNENVGGLVGVNSPEGNVGNSYSTGGVTGTSRVGGLVGWNYEGSVGHSFWDIETSGQATSDGGMGKNTTGMQAIATFSGVGWNVIAVADPAVRNPSYIWNIVNGVTYPFLSWQPV